MGKELFVAAQNGDVAKLESILTSKSKTKTLGPLASLRRGPGVNSQDDSGHTPLHLAALNGKIDAVVFLLQMDGSANIPDNQGSYPLHLAAFNGHSEIIQTLICRGPSRAKVNEQNMMGDTPLHVGSQYGHCAAVRALLENHADARIRNNQKESPLDLAANYGKLTTVQMLVLSDPGVLSDTIFEHSPLHLAAKNGHTAVVEFLLDCGMAINKMCQSGTALHEAALFGKTEVVRLLLQRGADVKAVNINDETVLDLMEKIPSQRSQEITGVIYEQFQPPLDGNALVKSLTFSGKQIENFSTGNFCGSLPAILKTKTRPSLDENLSFVGGETSGTASELNGNLIAGNKKEGLPTGYHCLTYPKITRKSNDFSLANISPMPRTTNENDKFDFDTYGNIRANDEENKCDKRTTPDVRYSSPAGFEIQDADLIKTDPGKRSASLDKGSLNYDFVPIKKKTASPPISRTSNIHPAPSLNYDFVSPHSRMKDETSNFPEEPRPTSRNSSDYTSLFHGSQGSSLDSQSSTCYKQIVLDEKKKFDSLEHRYQKLTYDTNEPNNGGNYREPVERYDVVNIPRRAIDDSKLKGNTSDGFNAQCSINRQAENSDLVSSEDASQVVNSNYNFVPVPRPATESNKESTGVYCLLGDFDKAESKVEKTPGHETPPTRSPKRSPTFQRKTTSPKRLSLQGQGQAVFYEVPPNRVSPVLQRKTDIPRYETPPLRILPKEAETSTSSQEWVTFDSDEPKNRPTFINMGSSMFYTGTSEEQTSKGDNVAKPATSHSPTLQLPGLPLEQGSAADITGNKDKECHAEIDPPLDNSSDKEALKSAENGILKPEILHRTVDKTNTEENDPNSDKSSLENLSQFSILHKTFDPSDKINTLLSHQDVYDNVKINNKLVKEGDKDFDKTVNEEQATYVENVRNAVSGGHQLQCSSAETDASALEDCKVSKTETELPVQTTNMTSIKASGIKQKRTTLERTSKESHTSNPDKPMGDGYRLSSLKDDNAFNETYEWTKIDRFLESLEELVVHDLDEDANVIAQESVEALLTSMGLSQYEAAFIANGYDDINFLGGIIVDEGDLLEIGIQNPKHISALLEAIKKLPEPPQIGSDDFPIPNTVREWLQKIKLPDYEAKFIRAGYENMDRVCVVWEFELLTVIDIGVTGHRKRMAHSLGNFQKSPLAQPQRTWAEKFAEADDGKPKATSPNTYSGKVSVDDSMDVANRLLETAENMAKDVAMRNAPAEPAPPKKTYVRTVGNQTVSNKLNDIPAEEFSPEEFVKPDPESPRVVPPSIQQDNPTWRHRPEDLLYEGVRYRTRYLGSHLVKEVRGKSSTVEACQKLMKSTRMLEKVPEIQLTLSVRGIDYVDLQSKKIISSYDIRTISYCAQDPNDLAVFAYITKDTIIQKHYCHVFKAWSLNLADEIILTIGQCFELAYEQHRLLVEAKRTNKATPKEANSEENSTASINEP